MITNADIQISNKGYANRDFYEIFQELVDIFPTLTTSWDPNMTNNSDPVFILIEELALVANRLFYYIDKSSLEQYPTSATQEDSFRRVTELLGFNMDYYRSASSEITFTYLGGNSQLDQELGIGDYEGDTTSRTGVIVFKAFDTTLITDDSIVYTILEDIELTKDELTSDTKVAMQGEIKPLVIDGSAVSIQDATLLQLYDLDENNRVYFNDTMVAENGVFINKKYYSTNNVDDGSWRRVDNLLTNDRDSRVYKVGYDSSKGKPYIQFPEWIGDIIGDGIQIYYIVCEGELGQAGNNTLTQLNSWLVTDGEGVEINDIGSLDSSSYSIANGSSVGAKDKDTIDESYISFKKQVGTFNTLVSPQDYSDGIYEYQDDKDSHYLVSALQVTDPERDPNKILPIWARKSGSTTSKTDEIIDKSINPCEVYPHGTLPVSSDISTLSKFNASFGLIGQDDIDAIDSFTYEDRVAYHTFTKVPDDDIDIILEKATLRVNIATTTQVNETEQAAIISNVKKALYRYFNAREVDFGEEIPYESLHQVMLDADSRISLVTFDYPTLTPYIVTGDGTETLYNPNLYTSQSETVNATHYHDIEIVVNNIVAGRVPLYGINSSFSYAFDIDYSDFVRADELAYIKGTTEVELPTDTEVTLASNHVIQVIEDSYLTTLTYPAYVYYSFTSETHTSKETAIPKNSVYQLGQGEILYIYYTDENDEKRFVEYKEGDIFTPSFDLYDTTSSGVGENEAASRWANALFTELVSEDEGAISLYALGTDETIEIVERNETILNNAKQSCFWYILPRVNKNEDGTTTIENEEGSLIFKRVGETSKFIHVLENGEFFIYPNKNKTSLCVLATGTRLEIEPTNVSEDADEYTLKKYNINEYIDTAELETAIASSDVGKFEDSFMWEEVNFKYSPLTIIETVMTVFVEDEKVTTNTELSLTDEWQSLSGGVTLSGTLDGTKNIVTTSEITNAMIRTIYRINGSAYSEQIIEENDYCHPTVVYSTLSDKAENSSIIFTPHTIDVGEVFQVYSTVDSYGDVVLRTAQFEQEGETLQIVTGEYDYLYSLIHYNLLEDTTYSAGTQGILFTTILWEQLQPNSRDEYVFNFTDLFGSILDENKQLVIDCNQEDLYISIFDSYTKQTHLFKSEDGVITLDLSYIDTEESEYNLYSAYISVPLQLAINPYLESAITEDGIIDEIIKRVEAHSTYDYLGTLSSAKLINSYDPVYSFFDSNNLYNIFTLEKIDFDSSEFTIVGTSRKVS